MNQDLTADPILDEIHRTRREMAEKFGGDLRRMLEDARQRQAKSGRATWRPAGPKNTPPSDRADS